MCVCVCVCLEMERERPGMASPCKRLELDNDETEPSESNQSAGLVAKAMALKRHKRDMTKSATLLISHQRPRQFDRRCSFPRRSAHEPVAVSVGRACESVGSSRHRLAVASAAQGRFDPSCRTNDARSWLAEMGWWRSGWEVRRTDGDRPAFLVVII